MLTSTQSHHMPCVGTRWKSTEWKTRWEAAELERATVTVAGGNTNQQKQVLDKVITAETLMMDESKEFAETLNTFVKGGSGEEARISPDLDELSDGSNASASACHL